MNISKQVKAIKEALHFERNVEVTYHICEEDTDIVTYYVSFTQGTNDQINRKIELTVSKNRLVWAVTDYIGISNNVYNSLEKAIREAK